HVCIEGETGVGKTTFIKEVLEKQPWCTVFYGIKELAACARCNNGTVPILFLDEINAQGRQFNCLEGLYTGGVVDDAGNYHPTNPHMRVVSCQNPKEYGGERREIEFLKRHPNTITFTALPDDYLASKYNLDKVLLQVFKKVPGLTPRELEMMQLMPDPHYAAYLIARCALPLSKQKDFTYWFTGRFPLKTPHIDIDLGDFELTESRQEICSLMCDLLSVRKKRKSGGLGAISLMGLPGDGKSLFAEAICRAMNLRRVEPHEIGTVDVDAYCKVPAKMNEVDKRKILLTAFHAGQVVIEEEANVAKPLESLHNAILMGYDEEGKSAEKDGFFIIRTQNDLTSKGRRPAS
ncbi:MAG: ATP-binding protein, partial [Verrucomicrobia bacterium]|nr:ATP-binding protein [Verrucomicrobiota bacterium]